MIKEVVIGLFSGLPSAAADKFYLRFEGPNVTRICGAWLRRYQSYRAYDPPPEAVEHFGAKRGRYTELWFANLEEYQTRPPGIAITLPPIAKWQAKYKQTRERLLERTIAVVPALPTESFLVQHVDPEETPFLRWVCAIKYPDGVSIEEGEKWFLDIHSQEAKQQPGLLGYYSYRCLEDTGPGPGGPPRDSEEPPPVAAKWVRINELWYESFEDWRQAVIESPPKYTPPPWGGENPFVDMRSNFIALQPDVDFLKGDYTIP